MDKQVTVPIVAPDQTNKNLMLPAELHQWFKDEAKRQRRSINTEMLMALEYWRKTREIMVSR